MMHVPVGDVADEALGVEFQILVVLLPKFLKPLDACSMATSVIPGAVVSKPSGYKSFARSHRFEGTDRTCCTDSKPCCEEEASQRISDISPMPSACAMFDLLYRVPDEPQCFVKLLPAFQLVMQLSSGGPVCAVPMQHASLFTGTARIDSAATRASLTGFDLCLLRQQQEIEDSIPGSADLTYQPRITESIALRFETLRESFVTVDA